MRITLPFGCTEETVDRFADAFRDAVTELRERYL